VQNRPAQDTRPVPKDPPTQTKEAWGKTHADKYKDRPVPKNVLPKEQWGADHWNNWGKTETRILPGGGQFSVQPDGTLSVNTESIGAKAQQKFKDFANRYNSSDGSNFQDIANGINNLGYNESTILSNSGVVQNLVNAYYGKVPKWDPTSNKAYQPPMGAFDPSYYMTTQQGKDAFNQWQKELGGTISIGGKLYENVSLVGRYDQNTFLQLLTAKVSVATQLPKQSKQKSIKKYP
jgi:hypothetical protein